jgi:hypothetical protein
VQVGSFRAWFALVCGAFDWEHCTYFVVSLFHDEVVFCLKRDLVCCLSFHVSTGCVFCISWQYGIFSAGSELLPCI